MTATETWTIGRLLEWTTGFLKSRGAESPRLDAEVLLAHALNCQRIELYTAFAEIPRDDVRAAFRELVKRRSEGMPVAYLVGHREFFSLDFRVTPDVLIPRPETELLVIHLLDLAKAHHPTDGSALTIADVGTGSGILAICAARRLPTAQVTAIDISRAALDVARDNARRHGVLERIAWYECDLFEAVPAETVFDFVVSNPPYVTTAELAALPRDVRDFEPHRALVAGDRGTEVIEQLVPQAAQRLTTGGWLLIEVSPMLASAAAQLLTDDGRFDSVATINDLAHRPRLAVARKT